MEKGTHPRYEGTIVTRSRGNTMKIRPTVGHDLNLDVCDKCYPFLIGKQRDATIDSRIDHFSKRFGTPGSK